ncbi:protein O-GlcNAcase [Haloplasma contractile]|uniref:Hyaluronoglucosaminidase protein n=1 Tax=Haloplasma contractile SSD-17B TaxID=1033810 RepID=U2FLM2_9MOLU|nr:protein O-GlcNAcase [Haloplasma contractile]ERJ13645.1 hyaluronoglucosaminidase protein [Haloplasma contractile SSD-17B]
MVQLPYIIKDVFTRQETIKFEERQQINVNILNKFSILEGFEMMINNDYVKTSNESVDLQIIIHYKKDLKEDAYNLQITPDKKVIISSKNKRGIRYAFAILSLVITKENNCIKIPTMIIEDEPSLKKRGIIEGFYGVPWSHKARLDVIDTMAMNRMNTFMYAPKDDSYHREKWRELYPKKELNKLLEYKSKCDEYDIDFYYCISPGKDFDYTKDEEFKALYHKVDQIIKHGVRHFSLLLDDIDYKLKGESLKRFKRPGIAHAYISNKLYDYIESQIIDCDYIMCPTEYFQNWDTEYRTDLKQQMNQEIEVFWTGYNTVAEVITDRDGHTVKESFGHELVLWENYPVNDFSKERLYLGPLVNRSTKLSETHIGMVSNPMNQWYASKIPVITTAHYMWNPKRYMASMSLKEAIQQDIPNDCIEAMSVFIDANSKSVLTTHTQEQFDHYVSANNKDAINKFYHSLKGATDYLIKNLDQNLLEDIKPWFDRVQKEYVLWNKVYNEETISEDDIKEVFEMEVELGVNVLLNSLIKWNIADDIDLEQYIKKTRFNFWGV